MKRFALCIVLTLWTLFAAAADLTPAQLTTLRAHIIANTAPTVVAALAARDDDAIRDWYNTASTTDAWEASVDRVMMFEATPLTQFDGLTAGKRDAWRMLLEQSGMTPIDFGRPKMRSAVRDIWATAQADAILQAFIRKATRGELVFGGAVETSGTVSATDLNVEIVLTTFQVSTALNAGQ